MALFQRQPINLKQNIPYSISYNSKTVLIIGLGNPGREYTKTRHNVGFASIDYFADNNSFAPWQNNKKLKGLVTESTLGSTRVILLKPTTYMNLSGEAAQAVASFYKIPLENIVSVYDELSIPFGQIRNRVGGQSAGHNGVKSLMQHLGASFGRVRIGIKNSFSQQADDSDFVLGKFTKDEQETMPLLFNEVSGVLTEFVYGGTLPNDTRKILL